MPAVRVVAGCAYLFALAALSGCATYRLDVPRPTSYAIPASEDGAIRRALAPALEAHPGQSAFTLLQYGERAFLSRAALADIAEHSLDVQYYIYEQDESGIVLADHLLAAARRGVRVRLLVDDNNLVRSEDRLATLAGHRNIEIRVFNPYHNRVRWMRPLELVTSFGRVQRRMHNKIFAVDAQLAVIGGRNIADSYFDLHRSVNFSDVELLAAGPIARAVVTSFDDYWNSPWAVPIEAFLERPPTEAEADAVATEVARQAAQVADVGAGFEAVLADVRTLVFGAEFKHWGEAELLADPPEKIDESRRAASPLLARAYALWRGARQEVLVESAYLVPLKEGADLIAERARAGVRVRVLTNSLASTDVLAVHAGYAKRRRELLAAGVELYEFQAEARHRAGERRYFRRMGSGSSLHSKVMVIDRELTWVGSFNIDPRSALLNTELAVVVRSPSLAEATARMIESDLAPDRAWQLSLLPPGSRTGRLYWTGERQGELVRVTGEPGASLLQRFLAEAIRWLPGVDRIL
ncbi:MAG: phospholipase D family protein [Proteobacteria bacterium]|nr:phospholipase D family protein [Pseudomonadota bacterium]